MEINPHITIQPEGGIGGDDRNPSYIRYGGEVTLQLIHSSNPSLVLYEEVLGQISSGELGTFPQWHKFIFYLLNTTTGQKYYPEFGDIINGYSTIDFYPSHTPGDPLPYNPEDWWTIEIERDYSLAAMPPPEILNLEYITNPFLPAGEIPVPLPGNIYAIVRNAETQGDALWIDKPSTQLIMDELGSHIGDTLFFGQMNVGDTLRFFLRSPNSIVNGMNLYPQITPVEQIMPDGKILIYKLDFEDWTDLIFENVNVDIYLQPDSGAYAGPIAIFFDPEQIGPGETTTITFKKRHINGTLEDIDSTRTFEVGVLDGCMLGMLNTEQDFSSYFYDVPQPIYFIADSSAESGTVMIRAGLIESIAGKMIRGNLEEDVTAETKTQKRYDIAINKTGKTTGKINNNYGMLSDDPQSFFCQSVYYVDAFGVGSLGVGGRCPSERPTGLTYIDENVYQINQLANNADCKVNSEEDRMIGGRVTTTVHPPKLSGWGLSPRKSLVELKFTFDWNYCIDMFKQTFPKAEFIELDPISDEYKVYNPIEDTFREINGPREARIIISAIMDIGSDGTIPENIKYYPLPRTKKHELEHIVQYKKEIFINFFTALYLINDRQPKPDNWCKLPHEQISIIYDLEDEWYKTVLAHAMNETKDYMNNKTVKKENEEKAHAVSYFYLQSEVIPRIKSQFELP